MKLIQSTPEYRYFSWNSRTMRCARRHGYFDILNNLIFRKIIFSNFVFDFMTCMCTCFNNFSRGKNNFHIICVMEKLPAVYDASWHLVVYEHFSSNFKFHFITQMYISSNIFTRKKKSFSHHLRYGKSARQFMMTPIMGRPDGTYGDKWDLSRPNFVEN